MRVKRQRPKNTSDAVTRTLRRISGTGEFIEIEPGKLDSNVKLRAGRASTVENAIGARCVFDKTVSGAQSRNSDSDMMAIYGTNRRRI